MPFDPSCIHQFTMPGDSTNTYVMLDAAVAAEALAGLTTTQQAVVNSYRWVPTQVQIDAGEVPQWAGNDPAPVYFRTTLTKMKAALVKRWREPSA